MQFLKMGCCGFRREIIGKLKDHFQTIIPKNYRWIIFFYNLTYKKYVKYQEIDESNLEKKDDEIESFESFNFGYGKRRKKKL